MYIYKLHVHNNSTVAGRCQLIFACFYRIFHEYMAWAVLLRSHKIYDRETLKQGRHHNECDIAPRACYSLFMC